MAITPQCSQCMCPLKVEYLDDGRARIVKCERCGVIYEKKKTDISER